MPKIEQRRACLRDLLDSGEVIVAPGAYDALTAKLIEQMGFQAAYVTGAGVAVTKLGVPDIGLVAMTEQLETAKNIVNSTQIPIICDIDTGYGNALNLMRTVREFERIGVSAVQVEDQLTPKRCGHIDGKQVVSQDEMLRKIEAFKKARTSKDLFLIARTDALAVYSFNDAIRRAEAYAEAGADAIFIEAPRSIEEIEKIPKLLPGIHLVINMVEGSEKTPLLDLNDIKSMGYSLVLYPISILLASIKWMKFVLKTLKQEGSTKLAEEYMSSFSEMFQTVDLQYYRNLEKNF